MRNLAIALLVFAASRMSAQRVAPVAHVASQSVLSHSQDAGPIDVALNADSTPKHLSLGRHVVAGAVVGVLTLGATAAVALAVENSECLGCAPIIIVPVVIGIGAGAGALAGTLVYGVRRLSAKERARRAAPQGN
jgi:hypothetical protein